MLGDTIGRILDSEETDERENLFVRDPKDNMAPGLI